MKKIYLSLISLFILLSITGCSSSNNSSKEDNQNITTIANPIVEYSSLEEINEKLNVNLVTPGVMGLTDETYEIINNNIAQYSFEINGIEYTIRAAHNPENGISGIYQNEKLLDDYVDEEGYACGDSGKLYTWREEVGSDCILYTIYCEDNNTLDKEQFLNIAKEIRNDIENSSSKDSLTGDYYDQNSERATAKIVKLETCKYSIIVQWSSSALEYTEWSMSAELDSDNNLVYTDCVKKNIVLDDSGKISSEEIVFSNNSGYFKIDTYGKLSWEGSSEEDCKSCLFVKE